MRSSYVEMGSFLWEGRYEQRAMAVMPCLQEQSPDIYDEHCAFKFSIALPEMQTENLDKCLTTKYINCHRARHKSQSR